MPNLIRVALDDVAIAVRGWPCPDPAGWAVVPLPGTGGTAEDWNDLAGHSLAEFVGLVPTAPAAR